MTTYFITGIDTDIGKTYATAFLVNHFKQKSPKHTVITQKLIQTGDANISSDILTHRTLTKTPLTDFDHKGITCPYVLSTPASPHLASKIDNTIVDIEYIYSCTKQLQNHYNTVLLEGAGGVLVPLTDKVLTLDYIAMQNYPVILVTCGRLGSINHTLLSLEAIKNRNLTVYALVYNHYFDDNHHIKKSTQDFLQDYLKRHLPNTLWIDMPSLLPAL